VKNSTYYDFYTSASFSRIKLQLTTYLANNIKNSLFMFITSSADIKILPNYLENLTYIIVIMSY